MDGAVFFYAQRAKSQWFDRLSDGRAGYHHPACYGFATRLLVVRAGGGADRLRLLLLEALLI